ncbi:MAG: 16S rRNA (cytosine(967)-C(5))-methyltransferase RsmB [Oscillospiraceae bacterium]|jgi:16S rRNA (cytosine967-C5)-methyltransferase|nr:16S rRNA (cytosine(967)-C(5))-methyltransferase RsmB [Oscillospiraceae bacterium]
MNAREAALRALVACRKNGAWSDAALKPLLHGFDRREAALASHLCYGVLQNRMLLDFWISSFLRVVGKKLHPAIADILRLAVYQMQFMDKIPPSAAVNEAVNQTKKVVNPQAARLVNGVLRSILRAQTLPQPQDLATLYSHPQELVDLLLAQYGMEKTEAILRNNNEAPETVLQINTLKTSAQALLQTLAEARLHPWLPDCLTLKSAGGMEALPAFQEGLVYVQDAAAKLAVLAAGVKPDMHVLDCCAAPGGKSIAAAIAMQNRGTIHACDIHAHKLTLIEKSAQRLGIDCIRPQQQDAAQEYAPWLDAMDVVLADVPCSGLGVIRKKPDIRYKDLAQAEKLPQLQLIILAQQAKYVRAGGVLLYSTCTILRRENEAVVEEFLKNHPQFCAEVVDFPQESAIISGEMTTLLPCDHGTDGFFICKLRRKL